MQKNETIIYSYIFFIYLKHLHLNTIYVFWIGKWAKLLCKHAMSSKMFMIYSLFPPKWFLIHCKIYMIWKASAKFQTDVHFGILSLKCLCSILRGFCYPLLSSFLYIAQEIMKLGLDLLDVDEWQQSFVCFAFGPCLFFQC